MIGTMLSNRYELIEKIGEGGMAEVYKARCHKLNRFDAIKILKKEYAKDLDLVDKFKKEATAIANLSDNNIVNIFDVGTQEDIHYIVMEYVKGKTLKQIIRENNRLEYNQVIDIAIQITKALDCAHKNNIIHRDIKPQNILVTEEGVIKVTDFGIAKSPDSATITNSGKILGSAHYFSPEQAKGTYIDGRTDIYSLGIVMYEMVTGRVPFDAESPVSVALKHIQEPVVPPKQINERIPESLNKLILKCIEKEPIKRYQNTKDLLGDLFRIQKDANSEIIYNNVDEDYTRVMDAIPEEDYEDTPKSKISNKKKKYIIASLAAVLVICLGVMSAAILSKINSPSKPGGKDTSDNKITVPDIVGLTQDQAKKALEEKGLVMEVVATEKSDKPDGVVIKCSPGVGEAKPANNIVRVVVSGGATKLKVPDLKDIDKKAAEDMLKTFELELVVKDYEFNDTVPNGAVISQDPKADTEAKKGDKVSVIISKGPEIRWSKVPDLKNLSINDAERLLKNLKLNINKIPVKTNNKELNDKVESQHIPADTEVKEGVTINVSYYVYEEPQVILKVVPSLIGRTVKEGRLIAEDNKFVLDAAGFKDDDIIEATNPVPGTNAPEKSTITVTKVKPANSKPAQ